MKAIKHFLRLIFLLNLSFVASCMPDGFFTPAPDLNREQLLGVWETQCGQDCFERLVLKSDGTFDQFYHSKNEEDYLPGSSATQWRLKYFADGRVRLYLQGGRYFRRGLEFARLNGWELSPLASDSDLPQNESKRLALFYDPIAQEYLTMENELVLNIRANKSGDLLLLQMWTSSDEGFSIIGRKSEIFQRIDTP